MVYQFPVKRVSRAKPNFSKPAGAPEAIQETEKMGLIQGMKPQSIEEWRVSVALDKEHIPYEYQVPLKGGDIRGGYFLDFLVHIPFLVPVPIFGSHWHLVELTINDRLMLVYIERYYGVPPVILWEPDLLTQQLADETIRREFG